MKKTGRIAIAGLAILAALSMTACGDDDKKSAAKPAKTTTSVKAAASNLPPTPSAAELNTELQRALDPAVPVAEKLEMVQGAQADPELPVRLSEAYKQVNAKVEVTDVTAFGDTVNAKAKFSLNGQENIVDVPFVAENGKWKVQKTWACQMLSLANLQSVACTA
ncbi:hypothetical protein D5S18_31290 [Nocardia panacis]|uniref:Low molecular weight antigen MTB12-like C-terminal domain-containing protein n=1 Tax=Nocardia panacis TaxID=2340916 RepID=A0A3A4K9M3_9NOCA|nr:hypothetical protein [Nocardia panacis]RJO69152.1 hypothetical protein D5S18_31290 [Nocardia panacis]